MNGPSQQTQYGGRWFVDSTMNYCAASVEAGHGCHPRKPRRSDCIIYRLETHLYV